MMGPAASFIMMRRTVVLLCAIGLVTGAAMKAEYDVIVVGMGAAGSAAAARLALGGRRVLALEAQGRVGGRVWSAPFAGGLVELGAEWIHGTENSSVYDLAVQNNVPVLSQSLDFKVYRSDGSEADAGVVNDLLEYSLGVLETPPEEPDTIGHFITSRVSEYAKTKYPAVAGDADFMDNFLRFMDQVVNNYEATDSWHDGSTASAYQQLGGDQHMSWHTRGYKTLFDILLNQYNNGSGIPSLTLKLNTEVVLIKWPKLSTAPVQVTTEDGTEYKAQSVIVTVSVGVLKERHSSLFSPPLPQEKLRAIEGLSIGVVNKIELCFAEAFWPKQSSFYGFIWKAEDRRSVPAEDEWTAQIFGCSSPMSHGNVLTVWTSGDGAKLVETLPDEVVRAKVMALVRRFMGAAVPEPLDMIRSSWFSNRFTRGSYSYDSPMSASTPEARAALATPLADAGGAPRVLFAGEATHARHFSTVHGALASGRREADRVLRASPAPPAPPARNKL